MKRILLLFCLIFAFGCSKSDDKYDFVMKNGIKLYSYEKYKLSTGEEKERALNFQMIRIWDMNGKDFDFEKSNKFDLIEGYLWDNITEKSYKSLDIEAGRFNYEKELKTGKYAIWIMYDYDKNFTESHSTFEVKEGYTYITKYFKYRDGKRFAEW